MRLVARRFGGVSWVVISGWGPSEWFRSTKKHVQTYFKQYREFARLIAEKSRDPESSIHLSNNRFLLLSWTTTEAA